MLTIKGTREVESGRVFTWALHEIPFWLQLVFIRLSNGKKGVTLNKDRTLLPPGIELTAILPSDFVELNDGRIVWLEGGHGVAVTYNGRDYVLFAIKQVSNDLKKGKLNFYYLPGDIV